MKKKEYLIFILIGVVVCMMGLSVKLIKPEGKKFNFWMGAIHPEYYVKESQGKFLPMVEETAKINESCLQNQKRIATLESYELSREKLSSFKPKIETLTVVRIASSWAEFPSNIKTNISDGNVSLEGKGKKTENYSVVAFSDGTFIKVTTDKMSALRIGDKVVRQSALELKYDNGKYSVEETITYHPYYK